MLKVEGIDAVINTAAMTNVDACEEDHKDHGPCDEIKSSFDWN